MGAWREAARKKKAQAVFRTEICSGAFLCLLACGAMDVNSKISEKAAKSLAAALLVLLVVAEF
jgi:hypothetical protein